MRCVEMELDELAQVAGLYTALMYPGPGVPTQRLVIATGTFGTIQIQVQEVVTVFVEVC